MSRTVKKEKPPSKSTLKDEGTVKNLDKVPSILELPPNNQDYNRSGIEFPFDTSTTWQGMWNATIQKVWNPSVVDRNSKKQGVMLKIDTTPQETYDSVIKKANGIANSILKTYKIRIADDFAIPVPENLDYDSQSGYDNIAIDLHSKVYTAASSDIETLPVKPGDLVWVKGDKYLGPVYPDRVTPPKREDPVEEHLLVKSKSYDGAGASGDNYLTNSENAIKKNSDIPLVIGGQGHGEVQIIKGALGKSWIVENFRVYQRTKYFQGKVYIDRFSSNGRLDDINMIGDDIGRSTIIYMPDTCDPKSPLELIYWFHDGREFRDSEWKNTLAPQLQAMTKQRRNFVFIEHEMLWSLEDSDPVTGANRLKWGGMPSTANWTKSEEQIWKEPFFKNGYLPSLDEEVLGVLKKHFDVQNEVIQAKTLIGHGSGGIAIANAARQNQLMFLNPTKIVFSHATYKGKSADYFLENDLFDVFFNIGENVKLEVHVMWSEKSPTLPIYSASSFFGFLFMANKLNPELKNAVSYSDYKNKLYNLYTSPFISSKEIFENGYSTLLANKSNYFSLSNFLQNILYKGWENTIPTDGAKLTLKWTPSKTPQNNFITPDEILKFKHYGPNKLIAIPQDHPLKYIFRDFNGDVVLYNSFKNQNRDAVILIPKGVDIMSPYELIYFFHGDGDKLETIYNKQLQNAITTMIFNQKRNIVVCLMSLSVNPDDDLTWDGSSGNNFNDFHEDVLSKIKENFSSTKDICTAWCDDTGNSESGTEQVITKITETPANPAFFSIKAYGTGGVAARRAIQNFSQQIKFTFKRLDFLDASNGSEVPIIEDYGLEFGKNREFIFVVNPSYKKGLGDNSPYNRIKKYELKTSPGISVLQTNKTHSSLPYMFFALPSVFFLEQQPTITDSEGDNTVISNPFGENLPYSRSGDGTPQDADILNQIPDIVAVGGLRNEKNPFVRGGNIVGGARSGDIIKNPPISFDKKTKAGYIKQYGSKTSRDLYDEHIEQQLEIARLQHASTPSFDEESVFHKGESNIVWQGRKYPASTPFKVIRYDGTVPGYERKIGKIIGQGKVPNKEGFKIYPRISQKYWFEWDSKLPVIGHPKMLTQKWDILSSQASLRNGLKISTGALEGGKYRAKEQITHIVFHNAGSETLSFKKRAEMFAWKGFLSHFCIDESGQVYQVCDAAATTEHCSGDDMHPSTNPNDFSIAIEFLQGTSISLDSKNKKSNSLNDVLKNLNYSGMESWEKVGKTPLISLPYYDTYKGKTYNNYFFNCRRHNTSLWSNPLVQSAGTRAQHEAAFLLINFLQNEIGCNIGSLAASDGRLNYKEMMNTSIQSHYQLQTNRFDGISYIWWAWAHKKHAETGGGYIVDPTAPIKKLSLGTIKDIVKVSTGENNVGY